MSRESLDYYAEYQRLVKRQTDQMKQMQEMERELKKSQVRQKFLEDKAKKNPDFSREELNALEEAEKLRLENERLQRENKKLTANPARFKNPSAPRPQSSIKRTVRHSPVKSHPPQPTPSPAPAPLSRPPSALPPSQPSPAIISRQASAAPSPAPFSSHRGVMLPPPQTSSAHSSRRSSYSSEPPQAFESGRNDFSRSHSPAPPLFDQRPSMQPPYPQDYQQQLPQPYDYNYAPPPMPASVLTEADKAYIDSLASTLQARLQRSYGRDQPDADGPMDPFDADSNPRMHAILHDTQGFEPASRGVTLSSGTLSNGAGVASDLGVESEISRLKRELQDKKAAIAVMQSQFDSLQAAFKAEREVQTQALRQCDEYKALVSEERRKNGELRRQVQILELAKDQNDRLQVVLKEMENEREVLNDRVNSLNASLFSGEATEKARVRGMLAEHAEKEAKSRAQISALTATNSALTEQLQSSKQQAADVTREYGKCADELATIKVKMEGLEKDYKVARDQLKLLGAETGLDYERLREVLEVIRRNNLLGKMGAVQEGAVQESMAQPEEGFASSRGISLVAPGKGPADLQKRLSECERKLAEALTDLSIERSMAAEARSLYESSSRQVRSLETENSELKTKVDALQRELAEIERLLGMKDGPGLVQLFARANGGKADAIASNGVKTEAVAASAPQPESKLSIAEPESEPHAAAERSVPSLARATTVTTVTPAATPVPTSPPVAEPSLASTEPEVAVQAPYVATAAPQPPSSAPASAGLWKEPLTVTSRGVTLPSASSAPVPTKPRATAFVTDAGDGSTDLPLADAVVAADVAYPQSARSVADSVVACELDSLFTSAATDAPSVLQLSKALRVPVGPGDAALLTSTDNVLAVRLDAITWHATCPESYRTQVSFFDFDPVQGPARTATDTVAALLAQFEVDGDAAVVAQLATGAVRVQVLGSDGRSLGTGAASLASLVRGAVEPVAAQSLFTPGNSPRVSGEVHLADASGNRIATIGYTMRTMFPVYRV